MHSRRIAHLKGEVERGLRPCLLLRVGERRLREKTQAKHLGLERFATHFRRVAHLGRMVHLGHLAWIFGLIEGVWLGVRARLASTSPAR